MRDCHASQPASEAGPQRVDATGEHEDMIARPPVTRRLDLACGQTPRAGFEGVDIWPRAQHVVDLQKFPWPFEDESVLELHSSHYIEHIPMEMVRIGTKCVRCHGFGALHPFIDPSVDGTVGCPTCHGVGGDFMLKDALFAFFDECYRILVPGGWMTVIAPAHRNDRAFQDPTHRRFIAAQMFVYLNEQWRRDNKLDHYNVECNFTGRCDPVISEETALRSTEVASRMILHDWNTVIDWQAKIQKQPRLPLR